MKKSITTLICAIFVLFAIECSAQVSTIASSVAKQISKVFSKKSSNEFLKLGRETGVKNILEKIAQQTGEAGVKEAEKYASIYGLSALTAIEVAPNTVLPALDKAPKSQQKRIIAIAQQNNNLVKNLDADELLLESKFPSFAVPISKLGNDVVKIAYQHLNKSEIAILAKNSDALLRVKQKFADSFKKFVETLKTAPKKTIELLEKNPKVLFTGAALTVFFASKEELIGKDGIFVLPLKVGAWIVVAILCLWLLLKLKIWQLLKKKSIKKPLNNVLKYSIIVENNAQAPYLAEHGLAILIDYNNTKILFDTGASNVLINNAQLLGVDINSIKNVVISHGHNDHTTGLQYLPDSCTVYAISDVDKQRFSMHENAVMHNISMPTTSCEKLKRVNFKKINSFTKIFDDVYLTGSIPRCSDEDTGGAFYLEKEAKNQDTISDEQALLFSSGVLFHGCCHSGIINTLEYIKKNCKDVKIHTIIGGLHLSKASDERIIQTANYLTSYGVKNLHLLHCTGENAINYLIENCPNIKVSTNSVGTYTIPCED